MISYKRHVEPLNCICGAKLLSIRKETCFHVEFATHFRIKFACKSTVCFSEEGGFAHTSWTTSNCLDASKDTADGSGLLYKALQLKHPVRFYGKIET